MLEWVSRPYKRDWKKSLLLVLFIILTCEVVYIGFHNTFFVVLSAIFLTGSLLRFFLPTRYIFTAEEIKITSPGLNKTRRWEVFKSYYVDKNGVLLSPYTGKSKLENLRGLYIMFSNNKDEVVEFVKNKVGH